MNIEKNTISHNIVQNRVHKPVDYEQLTVPRHTWLAGLINSVVLAQKCRLLHKSCNRNNKQCDWFYPRDATLVQVLAMALCLSVCHKSVFYLNKWTAQAGFWHVGFFWPILHSVIRIIVSAKNSYKNKGTSIWNSVPKLQSSKNNLAQKRWTLRVSWTGPSSVN